MGTLTIQGAITAGPPTAGMGFPSALMNVPLATNPTPKPFSKGTGVIQSAVSTASPAFEPLSGVGPTDRVRQGSTLYFRCDNQLLLRISQTDPLAPSDPPLQRLVYVQGLCIIEFPNGSPLVLLEAQGAATIEYLIVGQ